MRMNRGIWILGLMATLFTVGNVYATVFFYVLMCFDSCLDIGSTILSGQPQSLVVLLLPFAMLIPSLAIGLAAWIWEIVELRRMNAGQTTRVFVALFPLVVIIVGVAVTLLTSVTDQGSVVVHPFNSWSGTFALALWPLLVALVAIFWRPARPFASPSGAAST